MFTRPEGILLLLAIAACFFSTLWLDHLEHFLTCFVEIIKVRDITTTLERRAERHSYPNPKLSLVLGICRRVSKATGHNNISGQRCRPPGLLWQLMNPAGDTSWNSYETTVMHVYTPKKGEVHVPVRRGNIKQLGYTYKLSDPINTETLYKEQFSWKPYSKEEMIRPITSSFRTKNLHTCRLTKGIQDTSPWRIPASIQEIRRAIADQYISRSQEDFVDKSKLMKMKRTIHVPLDWKKLLPRRLETEFRRNFQVPVKIPELQSMNFKYGCNAALPVPAFGPVPSLLLSHIWNQEHTKKQSTYERHYGKEYLDFVTILNSLSESEIKEYLETVPESERKILQHFLDKNYKSGNKHR
ncbi:testis-expressed protein 26 [Gracilinanus agilis]|uniref:testis-expressed protein 26 n=1 Tax=Gracilinanus agilis TaxID=191870 RepID=UPI001CFE423F|nr:testis-expressed protein 26 [Gracilinanus agilis]